MMMTRDAMCVVMGTSTVDYASKDSRCSRGRGRGVCRREPKRDDFIDIVNVNRKPTHTARRYLEFHRSHAQPV